MNSNFNLEKELADQSEKDWKFGAASQPSLVTIPEDQRDAYLPVGETQFDQFTDFTDCASRSPVNHYEALFSYHYDHLIKPENKRWLEDNGYIQNGKVTFSDRFIAVLSGTTHQGNSLKAPLETIRTQGLIPKKLLPKENWMKWEDYYDASKITQALKDLGQEFRRRFVLNYEQVNKVDLTISLKCDMIGVAGYAWNRPVNGIYQRVEGQNFNHAFLLYKLPAFEIYDNYFDFTDDGQQVEGDFTKTLAPDYVFYDYGYRAYISKENVVAGPAHVFKKNLALGDSDTEVKSLQETLVALGYSIPHGITNYYGRETKEALAFFQKDNGIIDDGSHFGPLTRLAMNGHLAPGLGFFDSLILVVRTFLGI